LFRYFLSLCQSYKQKHLNSFICPGSDVPDFLPSHALFLFFTCLFVTLQETIAKLKALQPLLPYFFNSVSKDFNGFAMAALIT
jgi:hypothetical protein